MNLCAAEQPFDMSTLIFPSKQQPNLKNLLRFKNTNFRSTLFYVLFQLN